MQEGVKLLRFVTSLLRSPMKVAALSTTPALLQTVMERRNQQLDSIDKERTRILIGSMSGSKAMIIVMLTRQR
jgi:hypothetical protein